MSINLDNSSEFYDFCEEHGYDPDTQYDEESEQHKRDMYVTFYMKHEEKDVYRSVSWLQSYEWGVSQIEIGEDELTRKVEQILTEKITYV